MRLSREPKGVPVFGADSLGVFKNGIRTHHSGSLETWILSAIVSSTELTKVKKLKRREGAMNRPSPKELERLYHSNIEE
jgi:hypothetical protein